MIHSYKNIRNKSKIYTNRETGKIPTVNCPQCSAMKAFISVCFFHQVMNSSVTRPNIGCPVKLEFQVKRDFFFKHRYIPNIAWSIFILKKNIHCIPGIQVSR